MKHFTFWLIPNKRYKIDDSLLSLIVTTESIDIGHSDVILPNIFSNFHCSEKKHFLPLLAHIFSDFH